MPCCCGSLVCSCVSSSDVPSALYIRFTDFAVSYRGLGIGSPSPPADMTNAASQIVEFIHGTNPQLTTAIAVPQNTFRWQTFGCTDRPCVGCSPTYDSAARTSSGGVAFSLFALEYSCASPYVPSNQFYGNSTYRNIVFASASGCDPPLPSGTWPNAKYECAIQVPAAFTAPTFCEFLTGLSGQFTIPRHPTFLSYVNFSYTTFQTYTVQYRITAGTITVARNPLP